MTLADLLDRIERGQIGHTAAMKWLGVESINELVAIVHANGRQMWGHRAMVVSQETRAVLRLASIKQQARKQFKRSARTRNETTP
jgi:hypothetical protein